MTAVLHRVVVGPLDTNCWLVHAAGAREALIVDPGDEADRILETVRRHDLDVRAIVLTHAHFDHVLAVPRLAGELAAPVLAHPADAVVWPGELDHLRTHGHWDAGTATADLLRDASHKLRAEPDSPFWDGTSTPVTDGHQLHLDGLTAQLLHTPGHSPGSLTLAVDGHLFTGDTLFPGGPGLTGEQWPNTDFAAIMASVDRLMTRPPDTQVHPGHGPGTTLGAERPHVEEWRRRGW